MKFLNKKYGLLLLLSLVGSLSAAATVVDLAEIDRVLQAEAAGVAAGGSFSAEAFNDVKAENKAQIAARLGHSLEGDGILSRDVSTALFPLVDSEMVRCHVALSLDSINQAGWQATKNSVKHTLASLAIVGLLGYGGYKFFSKAPPVLSVPASSVTLLPQAPSAVPAPAPTAAVAAGAPQGAAAGVVVPVAVPVTMADVNAAMADVKADFKAAIAQGNEDITARLAQAMKDYTDGIAGSTTFSRAVGFGFNAITTMSMVGAATYAAKSLFEGDARQPVAAYFLDNLKNLTNSLGSNAMEYSHIVGSVAYDKGQTDEVFVSVLSRSHGQFISFIEQYLGFAVGLRKHFVEQKEFIDRQMKTLNHKKEKITAQEGVKGLTQEIDLAYAQKARARKTAQGIIDLVDSTLEVCHPLANTFSLELSKGTERMSALDRKQLFNSVMMYLHRLCLITQSGAGVIFIQAQQLENMLNAFYGIEKLQGPDFSSMPGNVMAAARSMGF